MGPMYLHTKARRKKGFPFCLGQKENNCKIKPEVGVAAYSTNKERNCVLISGSQPEERVEAARKAKKSQV